ncbi:hypothetical protein P0F25_000263 [Vibrio metschnikovii]|nr:hypothetical protein [Vibrio metschnikovii]EKO3911665.1 hypothetical protein [Vibrio metschnikovii]
MQIQQFFEELESASDFELFRLQSAIQKMLEDPERTKQLKRKIQVGMKVDYFCIVRNHAIPCSILKIGRSRVDVQEDDTQKRWSIPFYHLNLNHIETEIVSLNIKGMSKAELSIGCTVGFISNKDNREYIGQISKLNPKRAVVLVQNTAWNVPYSMLFPVITTEITEHNQVLLPG